MGSDDFGRGTSGSLGSSLDSTTTRHTVRTSILFKVNLRENEPTYPMSKLHALTTLQGTVFQTIRSLSLAGSTILHTIRTLIGVSSRSIDRRISGILPVGDC